MPCGRFNDSYDIGYHHTPFRGYILELSAVVWVDLCAQGRRKDELADRASKTTGNDEIEWGSQACHAPSKESIEREVGDKDAVEELDDAGKHEEDQERVDRLEPRGGSFVIRLPQREEGAL